MVILYTQADPDQRDGETLPAEVEEESIYQLPKATPIPHDQPHTDKPLVPPKVVSYELLCVIV